MASLRFHLPFLGSQMGQEEEGGSSSKIMHTYNMFGVDRMARGIVAGAVWGCSCIR